MIYVVLCLDPHEGASISGSFSTREKAQKWIDEQNTRFCEYEIEETMLDARV